MFMSRSVDIARLLLCPRFRFVQRRSLHAGFMAVTSTSTLKLLPEEIRNSVSWQEDETLHRLAWLDALCPYPTVTEQPSNGGRQVRRKNVRHATSVVY